ncbi:hypothetical protein CA267_016650 [Alteromonas pelagimontana]|uniref:Uncharacterized protein n=1 Tax=Alteromonas pelagimontana TaxID=1858656 RepID=A0A6M4MGR0_9ALTE|nr:hypothetical protein [Alteromonas pelagimontana]QJR82263.1 hypothetical protein CA267_016650 [Alteromonas pelagimontana]
MKPTKLTDQRNNTLEAVKTIIQSHNLHGLPSYRRPLAPRYKNVVAILNDQQIKTTWCNEWTPKRLLRFLQRLGYAGLSGVKEDMMGLPKKLE